MIDASKKIKTATKAKLYKDRIKDMPSNISQKILDDAMNEIIKEDNASTTISSALSGHKGRMKHNYIKDYPKIAQSAIMKYKGLEQKKEIQNQPKILKLEYKQ